jgi:UPF0271 protein
MKIDLNSDMGESFGRYSLGMDGEIMQIVSSINIACAYHAGDPQVINETVRLAAEKGVSMGAHPGYPDLQGFGRRYMDLTPSEIENMVLFQVSALAGFVRSYGKELVHVKPHGALYNFAAKDQAAAAAVSRGVVRFSKELVLVGLAGSKLIEAAAEAGLKTASEGFPERGYNPDGSLMSRRLPGAVIHDPAEAAAQAVKLARQGIEVSSSQTRLVKVDTLCIHGDSPNALAVVRAIRQALEAENIVINPL